MGTTRSYWCDSSYFDCPDVPSEHHQAGAWGAKPTTLSITPTLPNPDGNFSSPLFG
jgi:hypothetical protein